MSSPAKYTKLKKVKSGAQKSSPTPYSPEIGNAASGASTGWTAFAIVLSIVAIGAAAAGLTVGTLGFIDARKNHTVTNNIINNITEIIYVNSTSNGTGIVETIVAGSGINVTDTDPANPIVTNTGLYDIEAGPGVSINKSNPHIPIISATGGGGNSTGLTNITGSTGVSIDYTDPQIPVISVTGTSNITTESLFTIIDIDVTAADLASAASFTIFTPSGSDVYIIQQCIVIIDQSVDFSGGGGDREVVTIDVNTITDSSVLNYELSSISALSTFTPNLYPFSALDTNYLPYITQVGVPITIRYSDGTTDWTTGSMHIRLYLLNTNAMAIGGGGDGIVYVKDVSITAAALASGGQVTILDNTDSAGQYEIITTYTSAFGSIDFSGGGTDRDITITDGTSEYGLLRYDALVSASTRAFPYGNDYGGATGILLPTANSISIPTVAGANIYAEYTGGTADWAAGEILISMVLRKIAGNNAVGVQAVIAGPGVSVDSSNPQYPIISATGTSNITTESLFTIVDVDVTAADLAGDAVVTLFTPSGSDVYIVASIVSVTALSTDFDAGGSKQLIIYTDQAVYGLSVGSISNSDLILIGNPAVLPPLYGVLPDVQQRTTQPNTPIQCQTGGGVAYVSGSVHLRLYLINTNAMAIGGSDNIVYVKDVSITAAGLASGGQVTILDNTDPAGQYEVITAYTSAFGSTDFTGGGGDQNLLITDGTSEYGRMNSLATIISTSTTYGGAIDIPVANSISIPTVAGADIYAVYVDGTTDYAAGELIFSMVLRKISGNNAVGVQAVIAGSGVSVDSSNPQYPVVSSTSSSSFSATLKANGAIGDVFFLSEQATGLGLYPSPNYGFDFATATTIDINASPSGQMNGIATDSLGNVYVAGSCCCGIINFGSIPLNCSDTPDYDCFIAKMDTTQTWVWAIKSDTTTGNCESSGIDIDGSDNIYISGFFNTDSTFGSTTLTSTSSNNVFIAKASSSGTWTWAIQSSGTGSASSSSYSSIAVDSAGNSYICVQAAAADVVFGGITINTGAADSPAIAHADTSGTWVWANYGVSVSASSSVNSIAIDSSNNVYITGTYGNTDLTFDAITLNPSSVSQTLFIASLDSTGATWLWAVANTGDSDPIAIGNGIAIDSLDNIYVSGVCSNGFSCTFGSTTIYTFGSYGFLFVVKLNQSGSWLFASSSSYPNNIMNNQNSITISGNDDIYIGGNTPGIVYFGDIFVSQSYTDACFVVSISTTGEWLWVQQGFSLTNSIFVNAITTDLNGKIYISGSALGAGLFGDTIINQVSNNNNPVGFVASIPSYGHTLSMATMLTTSGLSGASASYTLGPSVVTGLSGLTAGKSYYYDTSSGLLTTLQTSYYMGYALSTTSFLFDPSPKYISTFMQIQY